MFKSLPFVLLVFSLSVFYTGLPGQESLEFCIIRGRVSDSITHEPVRFADITCAAEGICLKTNADGGFVVSNTKLPLKIKINKFGYKDKTLIVRNQVDSVFISMAPLELNNNVLSNKKTLQYNTIFKRALEKLQLGNVRGSSGNSDRDLVFCHMSTLVDTSTLSIFDSYFMMRVNKYTFRVSHPEIARYAKPVSNFPWLSDYSFSFNVDPYINLPLFPEKYITLKKYLFQDGKKIAVVRIDLENMRNIYYINVADTSLIFIKGSTIRKKRVRMKGSLQAWQKNRSTTAEISFRCRPDSTGDYYIDYAFFGEQYKIAEKKMEDRTVRKKSFFAVVPGSSLIINAVNSQVAHEAITGTKRQINLNEKVILTGNTSAFQSETQRLLMRPYSRDFWAHNLYMAPVAAEQNAIRKWEGNNTFYSEDHHNAGIEVKQTAADSLEREINNNLVAVENVYLSTDRSDYLAGDTIWFSAFVLNNLHMDSTSLSRILYVDLIDADNKPAQHLKLIIINGRATGDIALKKDMKNGICRLRGYTSYMRNFQGEYLFEKDLTVHQSDFKDIVIVDPVIDKSGKGDSIDLYFHTILPEQYAVTEKSLEIFVHLNDTVSVKRTFSFTKNFKGSMGFFVPASLNCASADIKISLSDKAVISEQRISLQLKPSIDIRFFPESGKMIAGIPTVIAYKAIDSKGNPAEFRGDIIDQDQKKILHLADTVSGLGKFEFLPLAHNIYKARIISLGTKYDFMLPEVEPEGYIMNFSSDSDELVIKNNQCLSKHHHALLFTLRGAVYASMDLQLDTGIVKIKVPLNKYPKGILQVTLYDSLYRPVAERLIFNNRVDKKMLINIETDKKNYGQREKVEMRINVTDSEGNPLSSSLALSVTDAIRTDTILNSADIETYLYLASELKGKIDFRSINLSDTSLKGRRNTDLVMMTQGWRNYLWNSIRYTRVFEMMYPIEKGFSINGTVNNYGNGRSFSDNTLTYFDLKNGFNGVASITEYNKFSFDLPFFFNNHLIFIQNRNKKDKVDKMDFILDTLTLPEIRYRNTELPYNTYKAGYLKSLDEKYAEADSLAGQDIKYIKLGVVTIKAKSHPWYSKPDVTLNLDKEDPTGKKYSSIMQMIYAEFGEKAFTATGFGTKGKTYNPILVVDGAPMTASECPPCHDYYAYRWAMSLPVNEITDVKFYSAESKYSQLITPPPPEPIRKADWKGDLLYVPPAIPKMYLPVVSFKTYSHSYRGNPRGAIVFSYQGIYLAREFYAPDYDKIKTDKSDNRKTIYWNPDIKTDSTGRAEVSFYNSDLIGKALISISGVSFSLKDASSAKSYYISQ